MDGLAISPAARLPNEPTDTNGRTVAVEMRQQGRRHEVKGRRHEFCACATTVSVSFDRSRPCDGLYKECTPPLFIIIL